MHNTGEIWKKLARISYLTDRFDMECHIHPLGQELVLLLEGNKRLDGRDSYVNLRPATQFFNHCATSVILD